MRHITSCIHINSHHIIRYSMSIEQCVYFILDCSIYINWKIVIFNSLSNCQIYTEILFYIIVHNILQRIFLNISLHATHVFVYIL